MSGDVALIPEVGQRPLANESPTCGVKGLLPQFIERLADSAGSVAGSIGSGARIFVRRRFISTAVMACTPWR
jgi:hypothetical protein